jgi:O-acetyl-ADP-ribose deacetylase (regulator of RNase III)
MGYHNKINIIFGDITKASTDAIVNAAKPSLLGGSGVDGDIQKAAGKSVLDECKAIEIIDGVRCKTGEAKITSAGDLSSTFIIHTVGPVYNKSQCPEKDLHNSYFNSIELALKHNCKSIAFPAISCGKYGFPHDKAVDIAVNALKPFLDKEIEILFYVIDSSLFEKLNNALKVHKIN